MKIFTALLGHPVHEIKFRYQISFLVLGPPYEQKENFYIWGVGYKNRVKRVCGVHFWKKVQHIFFALIRKIFLQALHEISFRYQTLSFRVLGPPGTLLWMKWKLLHRGVGYQNRVKLVCVVHFWRILWKIFKNEDFANAISKNHFGSLISVTVSIFGG